MKLKTYIFICWLLCYLLPSAAKEQKFNYAWKFVLGDVPQALSPEYDDREWRTLDLPHDWAFENGYSADGIQKEKGGYASGGIGWYRKTINLSEKDLKDKYSFIDFDAVYMNSEVWINGKYLGKRPYGYISFSYDISRFLKPGKNVLAVRVDNSLEPSARWYHGCGIYGNVYLRTHQEAAFEKNGIFIITPEANGKVSINTEIISFKQDRTCQIRLKLFDLHGKSVGKEIIKNLHLKKGKNIYDFTSNIQDPNLWSPESPTLYTLQATLINKKNQTIDSQNIRFGFRKIEWKPVSGFYLNNKQVKLRGVCEHLEGGPTGAIYTEQLMRWKLQLLKDMGCNAIRTAHNPQLPIFYDLCDEMGILVLNEIFDGWKKKADYDYGLQAFDEWWEKDLCTFIRRDRNHPSVFLYSVGNETNGDIARQLVSICHKEDSTRLVTSGHSVSDEMDVFGVNGHSEKKKFLENYLPKAKAFIATENPHTWQVRGYYRTQTWYRDKYPNPQQQPMEIPNLTEKEIFMYDWTSPQKRRNTKQIFNSSYDNATVRVTARHIIELMRDKEWFSGSFRWTGFDYLGEAAYVHGGWPFRAFQSGALDLAGFKKDLYYLYQSEWTPKDMVHILPHWTHPVMKEGTEIPVWVYTTGDEVELIVNGESFGRKAKGKKWNEIQCEWLVPWQSGTIEAIAYRNGKEIARTTQRSASVPSQLHISIENPILKADKENISIITIEQKDANGVLYPYGENRIYTQIYGGARMLSFENGNPVDIECNFNATSRKCFFGMNRAFVQSTDESASKPVSIVLAAICGDKKLVLSDKISIDIKEVTLRGKRANRNWKVYYTTNGQEPTTKDRVYTQPFTIAQGTTVKAALYDGNCKILDMKECFTNDEGLHWNTPTELSQQTTDEQIEFEKSDTGNIYWYQENDGSEMNCILSIQYLQKQKEDTPIMEIYNNSQLLQSIEFVNSPDKDNHWCVLKIPLKIHSGANQFMLKSTSEVAPYIDQIMLLTDEQE
ncbi:glycoside hydrolase family 2 TIM barrel-domain containing protein [Bacteroides sp. GM023]|uniref:glycoside hydrolase family 2 TIM barrel-domain containing protein n=1 Tax=Bacteroides sp. GM023 TaxID=2723058 RepID=UPI00168AE791|nr:glycoside hydrolase family 2 TIM barrel-domain containing protein [Bacteroides sp. GM023]MBD3588420.1 DUF4982 domain-containing protein [Bacteroides sp. GM023]